MDQKRLFATYIMILIVLIAGCKYRLELTTLLIQNGDITPDALGETNKVWVFQVASDPTTVVGGTYPSATGGNIILQGKSPDQ